MESNFILLLTLLIIQPVFNWCKSLKKVNSLSTFLYIFTEDLPDILMIRRIDPLECAHHHVVIYRSNVTAV